MAPVFFFFSDCTGWYSWNRSGSIPTLLLILYSLNALIVKIFTRFKIWHVQVNSDDSDLPKTADGLVSIFYSWKWCMQLSGVPAVINFACCSQEIKGDIVLQSRIRPRWREWGWAERSLTWSNYTDLFPAGHNIKCIFCVLANTVSLSHIFSS